ncbi:mechanosensitive ion channel family protein [Shewanella sp. NIFS-20-20]|uniref:mechanosensitive ion channel family protein n=1 Tax=Shewanella sp. NIFS-20-20 TaxID=2853806 RepID=UPI001C45952C|nr:mechanosensitive ion channel domain-containing protein [Shewanella sp. NIFS-20-20]MBV7316955.1 mechanosensitive ion channel [Shewanella sp. NIFS-20-20]
MPSEQLQQELNQLQNVYQYITEFLVQYSFQLIGAGIIFLLGLWLANKLGKVVTRQFEKHQIDVTLGNFVSNLVRIIVIVMVVIIVLGKLGISITPMVAAIGAASLGAGLAIQGMLSNYAAGVTLIVTRPFVIGNTIEVKGVSGIVQDIRLGMTVLTNEQGEQITIPNKMIIGDILHNSFECRLVESHFIISYDQDIDEVTALLNRCLSQIDEVCQQPAFQVGVNNLTNFGAELGVRYFVKTPNYYQDKYLVNAKLLHQLKQANIALACPIREIHLQS